MVLELHEGADMAMTSGGESKNETVQEPYMASEKILHYSESPLPAVVENEKDKNSLEVKQLEIEKSRNSITDRVSRPPAIVIPPLGDISLSNNRSGFPATFMPTPSKPLDPNAPVFTPSPHLYPSFSPAMSPLGIECPYLVGSGVEISANQFTLWSPAPSSPQSYGYPSPHPHSSGLAPQTPTDQVSRSLFLSQVAVELDEQVLKEELSAWGHIRCIELERHSEGVVIVHYYDIRNSNEAFNDMMSQYRKLLLNKQSTTPAKGLIGGKSVYVQYIHPINCSECNQGILLVNNLEPDVSAEYLVAIFGEYGCVKDVRASANRLHKYVEFYDTRDADKAMEALDGQYINGKRVNIDFCRFRRGLSNSTQNGSFMGGTRNNILSCSPHEHQQGLPSTFGLGVDAAYSYGQGQIQYGGCNGHISLPCIPSSSNNGFYSVNGFSPVGGTHHSYASFSSGLTPRNIDNYIFDEKEVNVTGRMPRTTLMVKNIPNKYSQGDLIKLLDEHCLQANCRIIDSDEVESSYDFVYLPIDFKNKCNVGYGFVNFTTPEATLRFYKERHMKMWERFNSNKVCEICYARLQGLSVLKQHFQNSVFPCSTNKFLPAIYEPPRNGVQCSPPTFVAGHLKGRSRNSSFISCSPFVAGHLNGRSCNSSFISCSPSNTDDSSIFSNSGNNESAGSSDDMNTSSDHKFTRNQSLEASEN